MAKKTRTELSTLAINTNLPDNTQELITPTTERSQLTDERESVVNYKDDLGGVPNAGKFVTVATDGESLTMVDEPSGVPDWVTFVTALVNQMILKAGGDGTGTSQSTLKFTSYDGTLSAQINFNGIDGNLYINATNSQISLTSQINFVQGGSTTLRLETTGDITHQGNIMSLNAQQSFNNNPLYTFKFQGKITGPSGGSFTFEEFANIKGGKENATENNKAGYLSFTTGIADGTLTERLRISSAGDATFSKSVSVSELLTITQANADTTANKGLKLVNTSSNTNWNITAGRFDIENNSFTIRCSDNNLDTLFISPTGIATFSSSEESMHNIVSSATRVFQKLQNSTQSAFFGLNASGSFVVQTSGSSFSDKFTITSGGEVGIGISQSIFALQVIGTMYSTDVKVNNLGSGSVFSSGAGILTNTDPSDLRLKTNIENIDYGLSEILKLRSIKFNWLEGDKNSKKQFGFIAQEVKEIIPESVSEFDYEGNKRLGLEKNAIYVGLVKAIQEQQTIIEDLITRLEALEA